MCRGSFFCRVGRGDHASTDGWAWDHAPTDGALAIVLSIVKTSDFDYELPKDLIAQTPIEPRDHARMLVLDRAGGQFEHRHVFDLPAYLRPGDLLVLNDTRVFPARLLGRKETGGQVEILLLKRQDDGCWQALVRGKHLTPGKRVLVGETDGLHTWAAIVAAGEGPLRTVAFSPPIDSDANGVTLLDELGQMPLPPYIHVPLADRERYQTVFARYDGSAAAPTASLHFTPDLLLRLRQGGVSFAFVTLHISLDTFLPVTEDDPRQHTMHREWLQVSAVAARAVNETRLAGGRIIAAGTTSVRALETAAKMAQSTALLGVQPGEPGPDDRACGWQTVAAWSGETDLYLLPGHRFRAVDGMLTNFHLPRSTLLMLVSAFAGQERIAGAYAEAIARRYRFFSFGDAMLIL